MTGVIGMDIKSQKNYAVEVEDLTVAYDAKPVLWDIDLKLHLCPHP
jgi:manganese/zinc/iron transport system ATP- binding protein